MFNKYNFRKLLIASAIAIILFSVSGCVDKDAPRPEPVKTEDPVQKPPTGIVTSEDPPAKPGGS